MVESALVLYRDELISVSKGGPGTVDFDIEEVLAFRRKSKAWDASKLYWVHVHPSSFGTQPSMTDLLLSYSLKAGFGKLENFGIICFSDTSFKNIHGMISWYRFDGKQLIKTHERSLENDNIMLEEEAYMLKALSYGDLWKSKESESMALAPSAVTS